MDLLSFNQAGRAARRVLAGGVPQVVFPLRLEYRKVSAYRAVKESAFVFETPEQRAAVLKQVQQFERRTGAGLELLALRRTYGGRRQGSLTDLAEELYRLIREGNADWTKALNLNKMAGPLREIAELRLADLEARKGRAEADLAARIDARNLDPAVLATAYLLLADEVEEAT